MTGRDRVKYLHAITSNNIQALADGSGTLALLLTPQGRILAELEIYALPEKLLVLSHASQHERTVTTLKKYVIGSQVKIDDLSDQMGSLALEGPRAGARDRGSNRREASRSPRNVASAKSPWTATRAICCGVRISASPAPN